MQYIYIYIYDTINNNVENNTSDMIDNKSNYHVT